MKALALAYVAALVLTSCGDENAASRPTDAARSSAPVAGSPSPTSTPAGEQLYRGVGLVLQVGEKKDPELCLGSVAESDPPQCDGGAIPLVGWNWKDVPPEDGDRSYPWGVYGYYEVTGTYDGTRFKVVDAALPPERPEADEAESDTPCPEPEGGWEAPNPAMASQSDRLRTIKAAEEEADFAGAWVDGGVLNLAFTGDLDEHEAEVRETWGGALCVVEYRNSYRRLREIQRELSDSGDELFGLEVLFTDLDVIENQVWIGVVVIDPATRAELDERYEPGTIDVYAALEPVD